ncbi:hypothetical protein BN8_00377 [Fibrisoma limi BUZ 3]|uniref:Uncharacterized protein n=1 Tax=Fibrisoma limi BUZ 3 TaxID=1185876 RepID=I2GC29_9BACT|nr:hypothetical protein BN8_00377 [Fibrisoma limi BUZ 3]
MCRAAGRFVVAAANTRERQQLQTSNHKLQIMNLKTINLP